MIGGLPRLAGIGVLFSVGRTLNYCRDDRLNNHGFYKKKLSQEWISRTANCSKIWEKSSTSLVSECASFKTYFATARVGNFKTELGIHSHNASIVITIDEKCSQNLWQHFRLTMKLCILDILTQLLYWHQKTIHSQNLVVFISIHENLAPVANKKRAFDFVLP